MAPGNFMKVLMFLSACSIPLVIFVIVGYGLLMRKNVYEIFVKGAAEGLKTVAAILPTLVGLMAAVGILRASGFLDLFSDICGRAVAFFGFPPELVEAICVLTHNKEDEMSYRDYIFSVKKNPIARAVKISDIMHNLDLSRIPNPGERDYKRCKKYQKALAYLQSTE